MDRIKKIEQRTIDFIGTLKYMGDNGKKISSKDLMQTLGINSSSTLSEIKAKRQNIQPDQWEKFKNLYNSELSEFIALRAHHEYLESLDRKHSKTDGPAQASDKTEGVDMKLSMQALINLTESNKLLAEAHKEFSEANKILAKNNEELIRLLKESGQGVVTDSGSKKGTIALATTAALQDILFEKLAPLLETSKEELHAALRSKISLYQNLALKDHTQNNLSNVGT